MSLKQTVLINCLSLNPQVFANNKLCREAATMSLPPASWPLTFWSWKWCPSHVWRELPLCLGLSVLNLGPMYATDRCQMHIIA